MLFPDEQYTDKLFLSLRALLFSCCRAGIAVKSIKLNDNQNLLNIADVIISELF